MNGSKINNNIKTIMTNIEDIIRKYNKNSIEFKWIPRKENVEADKLAKNSYYEHIQKQCLSNETDYIKHDLNYTLNKWIRLFGENNINVSKLNNFISSIC